MIADVNTFASKVSYRRPCDAGIRSMYRQNIPTNWRGLAMKLANTAFMVALLIPVFLYFLPKGGM